MSMVASSRAVTLLWLDPGAAERVSRTRVWQSLVDASSQAIEAVLNGAEQIHVERLGDALEQALRPDGKLAPRLLVTSGELEPSYDEEATLRAVLALVAPEAAMHAPLRGAVDGVRARLAASPLPSPLADALTAELVAAYGKLRAPLLGDAELVRQACRAAQAAGSYRRRRLLGGVHLRALLHPRESGAGAAAPVVAYVPEAAVPLLPALGRFEARLLVEVRPRQDEYEPHPLALRVVALGQEQLVRVDDAAPAARALA